MFNVKAAIKGYGNSVVDAWKASKIDHAKAHSIASGVDPQGPIERIVDITLRTTVKLIARNKTTKDPS